MTSPPDLPPSEVPPPAQSRENKDPTERTQPMPFVAGLVVLLMVLIGATYLLFSDDFGAPHLGDRRTLVDLSAPDKSAAAPVAKLDGALLYASHCVACHQANGQGLPGVFPPLAGASWVTGDERVLAHILVFGVSGELVVNGSTYMGSMPSFAKLSDAELAALASFIRGNWSNQAAPVTPQTVAQARASVRSGPYQGGQELQSLAQSLGQPKASAP